MRSPRTRTLCALVAVFGLIAVVLLLAKPVEANFADDPLLRLQGFDRVPGAPATSVDCGSVPASLRSSSPATLYTLARDDACKREGRRRLMAALAAGAVVVVITLVVAVGSSKMEEDAFVTAPAPPARVAGHGADREMGAAGFGRGRGPRGPSGPSAREAGDPEEAPPASD